MFNGKITDKLETSLWKEDIKIPNLLDIFCQ